MVGAHQQRFVSASCLWPRWETQGLGLGLGSSEGVPAHRLLGPGCAVSQNSRMWPPHVLFSWTPGGAGSQVEALFYDTWEVTQHHFPLILLVKEVTMVCQVQGVSIDPTTSP